MKLFNLGLIDWLDSQLFYHAEPRVGIECLNILAPRQPYVCIGLHQNAEYEVDLEKCKSLSIPVFRREVGGGSGIPRRAADLFSAGAVPGQSARSREQAGVLPAPVGAGGADV